MFLSRFGSIDSTAAGARYEHQVEPEAGPGVHNPIIPAIRSPVYACHVALMSKDSNRTKPDVSAKPEPGVTDVDLHEARLRQQAIGAKLRHMFDEVVNEPVPTEFLDILRQADERRGGGA